MKSFTILVTLLLLMLVFIGCATNTKRYCHRYDIKATMYVVDDMTFNEMVGGGKDRDGCCWEDTNTIYVRGGERERPSDRIVGHEIKHLKTIYGKFHKELNGFED